MTQAKSNRTGLPSRVSIHGGHSGEFCRHAKDRLQEVIEAYLQNGFEWVGITEHMPPVDPRFMDPDDVNAGITLKQAYQRFEQYMTVCRELQQKYKAKIQIFVGFEIETYTGSLEMVHQLLNQFSPDYIVGSVHHVKDILFDFSAEDYAQAIQRSGSIESLYCDYFDTQYDMLMALEPAVVGHFDLIRIFDPHYRDRFENDAISNRIQRNLELIKNLDLIMDFNVRSLSKGADEPYISHNILAKVQQMGIAVVPGDDSHGVDTVGRHIDEAIQLLVDWGFNTDWRKPS